MRADAPRVLRDEILKPLRRRGSATVVDLVELTGLPATLIEAELRNLRREGLVSDKAVGSPHVIAWSVTA